MLHSELPEQRDRLTFLERRQGRRIARQLFVDCRGNLGMCKGLIEERMEDAGISPVIWIAIAKLILALIEFWLAVGATDPGDEPILGEPGGDA